jgi:general secretion pathway protein D
VAAGFAPLAACATFPQMKTNVISSAPVESDAQRQIDRALKRPSTAEDHTVRKPATQAEIDALVSDEKITAELPPQPLPQLLNTVFGDILKVPYTLGPGVAARSEGVAIRGGKEMSKRAFFRAVQNGLKAYGLDLYIDNGAVSIVSASGEKELPATVVHAYEPDTPEATKPTQQVVALKAVKADAALTLLQDIFPGTADVKFAPDPATNSVVLSGAMRDVVSAAGLLDLLDRPEFAGRLVTRVEPIYLSPDDFANGLEDTLTSEGLGVSRQPSTQTVVVLSFPAANQVLIFVNNQAVLAKVQTAADRLNQPSALGDESGTFVYQVRNTDAQTLGSLVSGAPAQMSASASQPLGVPGQPATNTAGASAQGGGGSQQQSPSSMSAIAASPSTSSAFPNSTPSISTGNFMSGRTVIDPLGNRILFTGPPLEFVQLRNLLARLDTPPRQVLVEVTIAEVTLTDETRMGLEYFFTSSMSGGRVRGGTMGGLGLSGGGLGLTFKGSDLRAQFNAFASNNKVNILSRPRLVARSGSEAAIQVGTDVPIITSQGASQVQAGGTSDVLQTITYRQTGVILKIKPIVYGDNRIDLQISQEVSSQQNNPNTAIASPIILNRDVTTQLSLQEGATAVLGGLIDNSYTKGNSGVPFLKDIPVLGTAFRVDTVSGNKTELVVLVTPYIIRNGDEMSRFSQRYSSDMNAIYRVGHGPSYTLTGFGGHGVGVDLPQVAPASERPPRH